jgi:hypothetical protein
VRLTTSLQVGAKYFGCVVCKFQFAAGAEATHQTFSRHRQRFLVPLPKSASNNLQMCFLSPTGRLNFGFITERKLTIVLITPYSWGSQLVVNTTHQQVFWHRYWGERRFLQGESLTSNLFYFVIVLLSFFALFLFASFYQKYKKISSFYSCYFCLSVLVLLE